MSELLEIRWQTDHINDDKIPVPGMTTYTEVFERYATSDIGKFHAQQKPRYVNRYEYDHAAMQRDLGADVHPVEHGRYTHDEVLIPLLHHQNSLADGLTLENFSAEDIVALRLAAHMHDFGECEHPEIEAVVGSVTGDIAYGHKTAEHELVESAVRGYLKQRFYADIPSELWESMEAIIKEETDELAVEAFKLTELAGYYLTGLRAGYLAVLETRHRQTGKPQRDDISYEQLMRLARDVSTRHRETVSAFTNRFAFSSFILDQTTELYDAIQRTVQSAPTQSVYA